MRPRRSKLSEYLPNNTSVNTSTLRRHRPDYVLVVLMALLLVVGLITIYAISPGLAASNGVGQNYYVIKQFLAIGLGVVGFIAVSVIPIEFWKRNLSKLAILSGLAVLAVRVFGQEVNGAYRWIQIGGLSFQAVELIKFTVIIWLAGFLAQRIKEGSISNFKETFKPLLIVLLLVGISVLGLEDDLGSFGVIVIIVIVMGFIAGLPLKKVAIVSGAILIGLILVISTSTYRREHLLTLLHPTQNCQTSASGYQACQAVIAVGSGGVLGKGLGHGVQDFGYLPETNNDSIFAVFAEQFGFVGVTLMICLFLIFFKRFKDIMERTPDIFTRLVVTGVLVWLAAQALINIGSMAGVFPLEGITLPLISYGGTSIVFIMVAIGLVFNISHYTTNRAIESDIENVRGPNENNTLRGRDRRPYYAHPSRSS